MDQPCYKCGQAVEQGVPFCPHCSAPQIRVLIAEPTAALAAFDTGASSQGSASLPASQTVPVLAVPMQWSQALKPCALAALVASLLMVLGLNPLVGALSAGFLAVVFYRQRQIGAVLKARAGARLGALSGVLCFGFTVLLVALAATVSDVRTKIQEPIVQNAQKWAASHPADPQIQAALEQMKTPGGLVLILFVLAIFLFVLSVACATLGGALGGAIFGRRDRT